MQTTSWHSLHRYDYTLPSELIAQEPLARRDSSRLLVRHSGGTIEDSHIRSLTSQLRAGDQLIFNDSRVIPARLQGYIPTGGKVEIFLLRCISSTEQSCTWSAIGRPIKKFRKHPSIQFERGVIGEIDLESLQDDFAPFNVTFNCSKENFLAIIEEIGFVPLPPYIVRHNAAPAPKSQDRDRYQTVYGQQLGSVAAPTAGLHFSEALLEELREKGVKFSYVTLHVGGGTFLPVKVDDIRQHKMHEEYFIVPSRTLHDIDDTKKNGGRVIAVGTTALRCLESLEPSSPLEKADQWHATNLFLHPTDNAKHTPWAVDGLMTNFHQPQSTLFMLVCALIGTGEAHRLYQHAILERYRFFSYGDASLLWLR